MIDDLNILGCSEEDSYDDLVFKNGKLLYQQRRHQRLPAK